MSEQKGPNAAGLLAIILMMFAGMVLWLWVGLQIGIEIGAER